MHAKKSGRRAPRARSVRWASSLAIAFLGGCVAADDRGEAACLIPTPGPLGDGRWLDETNQVGVRVTGSDVSLVADCLLHSISDATVDGKGHLDWSISYDRDSGTPDTSTLGTLRLVGDVCGDTIIGTIADGDFEPTAVALLHNADGEWPATCD